MNDLLITARESRVRAMREYQLLFALASPARTADSGIAPEGEDARGIAKLIPRRCLSRSCKFDLTASRARVPLQQRYPATSADDSGRCGRCTDAVG